MQKWFIHNTFVTMTTLNKHVLLYPVQSLINSVIESKNTKVTTFLINLDFRPSNGKMIVIVGQSDGTEMASAQTINGITRRGTLTRRVNGLMTRVGFALNA